MSINMCDSPYDFYAFWHRCRKHGPPCNRCRHWNPQSSTEGNEVQLQLCSVFRQHKDFSCFEPRNMKCLDIRPEIGYTG